MGKRGKDTESPGLRIAFCHPDLGLGGWLKCIFARYMGRFGRCTTDHIACVASLGRDVY